MKYKFNTKIFIIFSFTSFILLSFVILFFNFLISGKSNINNNNVFSEEKKSNIKEPKAIESADPFVTINPDREKKVIEPILDGSDPVIGNNDDLVIVMFFDYECEFCKKQEETIRELINNKYKDKIKLIFKNFPINDYNSFSWKASVASRCAYEQDEFIKYHDLLYKNNTNFSDDLFLKLAKETGIDIDKFQNCYQNQTVNHHIEKNIKEASDLQIPGIPFYYVGSQEIMGELKLETLDKIIKIELEKNN